MKVVEARYVVPVDGSQLLHEGIDRILDPLDRHTRFFPPAEAEQFEQDTDGILFGIGIVLRQTADDGVIIERVLPGGSAHRAGFLAGDLVISVGEKSTRVLPLSEVSRLIRGELDSEVTIGVLRSQQQQEDEELQFTTTRSRVRIPSVTEIALFQPPDVSREPVGLVRLQQFQPGSTAEVREALEALVKLGARGWILDLRNNGGGLFSEAVLISSLFLARDQVVVSTRGRDGEESVRVTETEENGPFMKGPMVILIDRSSASASEIVAAALRDHRRAVLVGTPSFGKWSVQDMIPIRDGREISILKLTTQTFHAPRGLRITRDEQGNRASLLPDLEVETSPAQLLQMQTAWRSRSYDRIEEPTRPTTWPDPDPQETVNLSGDGDAALTAAIELIRDDAEHQKYLADDSPVIEETGSPR